MIEVVGNLWTYKLGGYADAPDARVITTNGAIRNDGRCVMGRGCAQEARDLFKGVDVQLGMRIAKEGNHVFDLGVPALPDPGGWEFHLVSFPVKHHWVEVADLDLIQRSCEELRFLSHLRKWQNVILPRPGCGNGKLSWNDVRPMIATILSDDIFKVISFT